MFASLVLLFAAQQPWAEIASEAELSIAPYYSVQCDTSDSDFFYVLITQRRARFDNASRQEQADKSETAASEIRATLYFIKWKVFSEYSAEYWREVDEKLSENNGGTSIAGELSSGERSVELIETSDDRLAVLYGFSKNIQFDGKAPSSSLVQGALFEVLLDAEEYDLLDKSALLKALLSREEDISYYLGMRLCEFLAKDGRQEEAHKAFEISRGLVSTNSWRDLSAYDTACSSLGIAAPGGLTSLLAEPRDAINPEASRFRWLTSDSRLASLPFGFYHFNIDSSEHIVVSSSVTFLNSRDLAYADWLSQAVEERLLGIHDLNPEAISLDHALHGIASDKSSVFLSEPSEWERIYHEVQQGESVVEYSFRHIARLSDKGSISRSGSATQTHNTLMLNTSDFATYNRAKSELRLSAIYNYCESKMPGWFSEISLSTINIEAIVPEVWLLFGEYPQWHVGFNEEVLNSALWEATPPEYLSIHVIVSENHLLSKEKTFALVNDWWSRQGSVFMFSEGPTDNGLEFKISAVALDDTTGSEPSKFPGRPDKPWAIAEASFLIELPAGDTVTMPVQSGKKYFGNPPNPKILEEDIVASLQKFTLGNTSELDESFLRYLRNGAKAKLHPTQNPTQ